MKRAIIIIALIIAAAALVWFTPFVRQTLADSKEEGLRRFLEAQIVEQQQVWSDTEKVIQSLKGKQEKARERAEGFREVLASFR